MACYLPDHLVRCLICKKLFSDARRLRCGCVYCYLCCLNLVKNYTLLCQCSVIHRFNSQEELEKALVIDTVVNDLVRQHIKQKQIASTRLVDYDSTSTVSPPTPDEDTNLNDNQVYFSTLSLSNRKQVAVAQPPCTICKKKSHMIILCQHCKTDICELCMEKHYEIIGDVLQNKWMQCKEKFDQINEHVYYHFLCPVVSHQNKTSAISKLDGIRKTIEERTKNFKNLIDNHRRILANNIDNHIQNLEQTIKTNDMENEYQLMKERLPKILEEEMNISNLLLFLEETEKLLQQLIIRNKQLKEMEMKIPYLSQPDPISINVSQFIGELKFDDEPSTTTLVDNNESQTNSNDNQLSPLMSVVPGRTRFPRRMRPSPRSRGGRGIQHLSNLIESYPRNNPNPRNSRSNGSYSYRGRVSSRPRPPPIQSTENKFDTVPNNQYQWSIDFKEIPYFLAVLDNRNRARHPDTRPHHRHDYMLFVADDYGQIGVYSLPKSPSNVKPSIIGTGELFPKNSRLLLESFTVYEYAIVVYVRRFEQRTNEIEHSKLLKAGLPIMKGEQGRCNDHGGMIYLFTHGGDEIDGVYQSHPIRIIVADQLFNRLWALNPMQNNVYCYTPPHNTTDIRKCFQEEEILLDFSDDLFEPSTMIQSEKSIGLIDTEHDSYRLYGKDDKLRLITTYQNLHEQQWKLTGGVIFKDNRSLLKLTEDKYYNTPNDGIQKNRGQKHSRRRLIELTSDGQEKRQIEADTLYSMVLGPNDEVILGFAVRSDRGLIQCY